MISRVGSFLVATTIVLAPVVVSGPASALSATCNVGKDRIDEFGPDRYRVKIKCSRIGSGTIVRGVLPLTAEPDSVSPWFTTRNEWHYGLYKKVFSWQVGTPFAELTG